MTELAVVIVSNETETEQMKSLQLSFEKGVGKENFKKGYEEKGEKTRSFPNDDFGKKFFLFLFFKKGAKTRAERLKKEDRLSPIFFGF